MKKFLISLTVVASMLAGAAAASGGVGGAGQDQVDPSITDGTAARELKQARKKWLGRGVSHYRMTAHRSCFCAGPFKVRVTVKKGKAVRISARPWYGPKTVPAMFRIVKQAIKGDAAVLDVKYDRRFGFPKRAYIDYIAMAADDEMSYRITNFTTR